MRWLLIAGLMFAGWPTTSRANWADDADFFEAKVRPILVEHCQRCHEEKKARGGLRLDLKTGWERGGDSGPAIVPGKPDRSLLIKMVKGGTETPPQMPPDNRLSPEQVAVLIRWVEQGAHDPRTGNVVAAAKAIDWEKAGQFWAFRPLHAEVPAEPAQVGPIDRFILAKLQAKGLAPVGPADRFALIRRTTFTLTGLPPTRDEVEAFLADAAPDAFARVVDRLLASPRYGEHQARQWLDVARYGEDVNFSQSKDGLAQAWRYRDWVIDAFNRDLPYDRFVKYQIAADRFDEVDREPKHLAALGLFGLGQVYVSNGDPLRAKAETLDDRVDTLTRGFLGLTVSCARCHDHKFDPIPQIDYYSIAGVFDSTRMADVPLAPRATVMAYEAAKKVADDADGLVRGLLQQEKDRVARGITEKLPGYLAAVWEGKPAESVGLEKETFTRLVKYATRTNAPHKALAGKMGEDYRQAVTKNLDMPFSKRNLDIQNDLFGAKGVFPLDDVAVLTTASAEQKAAHAKLVEQAKARRAEVPVAPEVAHGIGEGTKVGDVKVALRGNPSKPGEVAPRRFLRILSGESRSVFNEGSGRRQLAEAIADPKNPLTARVFVNRIWQQHFGRGLVRTPSNFGTLGEPPSHPELLDYLATQFIREGWSVKKLHREILLSTTFQRASTITPANQEADPENTLLWRMPRRRVTVEAYRDSLLAAAGTLDLTMGGKSENIDDLANLRRTVYGKVSRLDLSQLLRLFDFPDANITSDRRTETTVPQQLLFAMNSPFAVAQARALAARIAKEPDAAAQVKAAYWYALNRPARDGEIALSSKFLSAPEVASPGVKTPLSRLEQFAQALLASNEFVYID